jgi:hypothetical protein
MRIFDVVELCQSNRQKKMLNLALVPLFHYSSLKSSTIFQDDPLVLPPSLSKSQRTLLLLLRSFTELPWMVRGDAKKQKKERQNPSRAPSSITFKQSTHFDDVPRGLYIVLGQPMKIKYAPAPASNTRPQERRPAPSKDAGKRDVFSRLGSR